MKNASESAGNRVDHTEESIAICMTGNRNDSGGKERINILKREEKL